MSVNRFIFLDARGRRWKLFRACMLIFLLVALTGLVGFISALLVTPELDEGTLLDRAVNALRPGAYSPVRSELPHPAPWLTRNGIAAAKQQPASVAPDGAARQERNQIRLGFVPAEDDRALTSLEQYGQRLTHIAAGSLVVSGMPPTISVARNDAAEEIAAKYNLSVLPLLTNLVGKSFDPEAIEHYLQEGEPAQRVFADELVRTLQEIEAPGVIIEWEELDPSYQPKLTGFIQVLHEHLTQNDLLLWLCIPVGNDIKIFDLDALAPHVDRFVALLYYETGEGDPPGPIASLGWYREWLDVLTSHGQTTQWIAGIGTFGYDWGDSSQAERIGFDEAMARAASVTGLTIIQDDPEGGPSFAYKQDNSSHTVWFLDGLSFANQLAAAQQRGVGNVAINVLGLEDPTIWQALDCGSTCPPSIFTAIPPTDRVAGVGEGDFLTVTKKMVPGRREVSLSPQGLLTARYLTFPQAAVVFHQGFPDHDSVALTFDDGPDPEYTPQILDILKQRGVKAAFFVTGKNATAHPEIIERIVKEGHELGNHTFSHTNLSTSNQLRVQLELNSTQRVIERITGLSTLLFRPPYDVDRTPQSHSELEALIIAQGLGYIPVVVSIDSMDWSISSAQEIADRVKAQRSEGNVVLLHDGGGDRTGTVAALPLIIDHLERRGDKIVPLHYLLGVSRDLIMPPIAGDRSRFSRTLAGEGLALLGAFDWLVHILLLGTSLLLIARTLILVCLAFVHRYQEKRASTSQPQQLPALPPVTVAIAAYNEEKVISDTLQSLLSSSYSGTFEIVVVNDGSTDNTAALLAEIAERDSRVRVISQSNRGKAESLACAVASAQHDIVVTFDADTICGEKTIEALVIPLLEPRVAAVSGNVKVANADSWLGKIQYIEYLLGFNIDRRAHDVIDGIVVVPGAAGAFRRSAVAAIGGLSSETLAEDTDMTLALHRAGHQIRYAPQAVAWTEAPRTVRSLLRQRKRWCFGTLQCLWKHGDLLFQRHGGALSWFTLPSVWFCHIIITALIPLVDIACVMSLFSGVYLDLYVYALLFFIVDFALGLAACVLERERWTASLWVLPMRFLYRPLLGFAVISSLMRAIRGSWVGWGRQDRMGFSRSPAEKPAFDR